MFAEKICNTAIIGRPRARDKIQGRAMTNPSPRIVKYGLALSLALMASSLARADTFTLDTWSHASINGYAITGSFIYDAATKTILSDSTKIAGLCGVSASCSQTVYSTAGSPELEVAHSGIVGAPQYIAFYSDLGAVGTSSSLYAAWGFRVLKRAEGHFGRREYHSGSGAQDRDGRRPAYRCGLRCALVAARPVPPAKAVLSGLCDDYRRTRLILAGV